jgi:hypothetical protein
MRPRAGFLHYSSSQACLPNFSAIAQDLGRAATLGRQSAKRLPNWALAHSL